MLLIWTSKDQQYQTTKTMTERANTQGIHIRYALRGRNSGATDSNQSAASIVYVFDVSTCLPRLILFNVLVEGPCHRRVVSKA